MATKLSPAEKAWIGLATYVFAVDCGLLLTHKDAMTDAWRQALDHPIHRWIVIAAWVFTTKHLFFGKVLPWLDPFGVIALAVEGIRRVIPGG